MQGDYCHLFTVMCHFYRPYIDVLAVAILVLSAVMLANNGDRGVNSKLLLKLVS